MIRLSTSDPGFARDFDALVNARRETDADVARDVRTIIASVRDEGDAAVRAFTEKFDRHDLSETGWRIERAECVAADRKSTTSELQSLMRISDAVFCLKKKKEYKY